MANSTTSTPARSLTHDQCRHEYRAIRDRADIANAKFDAACKNRLGNFHGGDDSPLNTARKYVAAARQVSFPCRRCASTGRFITGSVNGKPTGPGGDCFRCSGKGRQTDLDARRNYGADMHVRVHI